MAAAVSPSRTPDVTMKPPDPLGGIRRPVKVSSSPNSKRDKETVQPKKKVCGLHLDAEDGEKFNMTGEETVREAELD
ncbi:unnamed protein product [Linum trigynum]|uniref:Uncharacterized protein n=1 Tax=Linum trigynum TaxID=586398 RepID=A0AAV2GWH2_9ROSI